MQVQKPIVFFLPEKVLTALQKRLKDVPPKWSYNIDTFHYIIYHIIQRQIYKSNSDNEYINIKMEKLKAEIGSNIGRYIKYLFDGEILERDFFLPGKKTFYYRLNPSILQGVPVRMYIQPYSKLFEKIIDSQTRKRKHYNDPDRVPEYLRAMWKKFSGLKFDFDAAEKWIHIHYKDDYSKAYFYLSALEMFKDKRFLYFKRNHTNNRLDTNLTNLKSDLRQFIAGNYVQIDLKNSQPLFLSFYLSFLIKLYQTNYSIPLWCNFLNENLYQLFGKQTIKYILKIAQNHKSGLNGEILDLKKSTLAGNFYENFENSIGKDKIEREEVKPIIFAVLFSPNIIYKNHNPFYPFQNEKRKFAIKYPLTYRILEILKEKDHKALSILLQRIESYIFLDQICPELNKHGIIPFTIHDSIIVEQEHVSVAKKICEQVFKKIFRDKPKFHVKSLKLKENAEKLHDVTC